LPGAAFLALLFHVERSLPYGKATDAASLSQMTDGIRRGDGSRLRAGSGLKKAAAARANGLLEKKGLLKRKTKESNRGGHQPTEYTVNWKAVRAFFANVGAGLDTPLVYSVDKPLSTEETTPLSTKETYRVRRSSSQSKSSQSLAVSVDGSRAGATPKKTPKPKTVSLSLSDDDLKPSLVDTPEGRLKAWATNRGDALSQKDWWDISAKAELRCISLAELADLAEKNNGDWKSSAAGLRWLVKQYVQKATDAPDALPAPKPKCPECQSDCGRGAVFCDGKIVACPKCSTPEWPAELEAKERARVTKATETAA
jgi:hypothetical protein